MDALKNNNPEKPKLAEDPAKAAEMSDILKALAHPTRLQIIAILCQGSEHVTGLTNRLGVSQALVSQQLSILRMKRIVACERTGGYMYYKLMIPKLTDLIRCVEGCS
jgi:DNA-binding transcriptional ArsR family regulator